MIEDDRTGRGIKEMADEATAYYTGDFTLEDFRQMVKDLENDYTREQKRRRETPDNSFAQIVEIAKQESGLYRLDNGMFVSPSWCREYLKALETWPG